MSHFLLVGKKHPSLSSYIVSNGHTYTLLHDSHIGKNTDTGSIHRISAQFADMDKVFEVLESLPIKPDGVIAMYENYIVAAARIAKKLGLPGMPITAARACTDKFLMRTLFSKAPEKISPSFALIDSEKQLVAFAESHSFPLIIKPTNLAKSLLVTKSYDMDELRENYQKSVLLLGSTYQKYAPNSKPQLLVEEFLKGSIHSVDAFVDSAGKPHVLEQIVDYQTGMDVGFDDNFHYSRILPSALVTKEKQTLRHCAEIAVRALGMKNSPAHVEIIMTAAGPRIVEIGARNGGYRERMHHLANDIDIIGAALQIALGLTPKIVATRNDYCAVVELFPKESGFFVALSNEQQLQKLPSFSFYKLKAHPEQLVGKASEGYKMCGFIVLSTSDRRQFQKDLDFVRQSVHIVTA